MYDVAVGAGSLLADGAHRMPHAWTDAGIVYSVEVDSAEDPGDLAALMYRVDDVAEIPRALRLAMTVRRG